MLNLLRIKFNQLGQANDNVKIIYIYRYISLIFISVFFLFVSESSALYIKLVVITCLIVASVILNKLYIVVQNSERLIIFLVSIETIGNILLLIPTGGLNSPYIWYAINTVLITLIFLNIYYCIANLSIYILSSIVLRHFINGSAEIDVKHFIISNSNFILGLVLSALVAELLLQTQKELKKKKSNLITVNNELNSSNNRLNKMIIHIISLYQAVNDLSNESDRNSIIEILLTYARSMIKSDLAFYCDLSDSRTWDIVVKGLDDVMTENKIIEVIEKNFNDINTSNIGVILTIGKTNIMVIDVKSIYAKNGIIGVELKTADVKSYEECNQQLCFLAVIGAMALERARLEKTSRRILINDEQNRIANEIHDSVCQRLFAISCSIQTLLHSKKVLAYQELAQELNFIKESIQHANKELRETIYGMSWKKNGINVFYQDITNYIEEVSRLYNRNIDFQIKGDQELLDYKLKKVLYRIVCEGVGNSMRHSECSKVEITMDITLDNISLKISDDGKGFEINKNINKFGGIGINNMHSLVNLYNGQIKIHSGTQGTEILICLPNSRLNKEDAV